MAIVRLRAPLSQRAGGGTEHRLAGATVGEVLKGLEARYPTIDGWILDDQDHVRPHVNVFVNGERRREDAPVSPNDVLHVLPSISGGSRR